ncbi:uncharacterized protein [Ptychodera flava]|uniref:uncharacterized protein n=1 Tax=Ptychodera flava TaxID=63121 RepID=UPI003969DBAA
MSSTQHHSQRGSTDGSGNGSADEYTDRDRQRIAAETDASIASVRAMGPSAFATGHQPDDKDDEVRPHTDQKWQNASNSPVENNKPKKNMGNKALIVNHSWGGSIQGGVTDSVHLLTRLLRQMGLSVYCTALTATEAEIKEAKAFGVELIVPSPIRKFKDRNDTPDSDWLYHHKHYFTDLKELANVRFVFGIGMVTSEAAFEIERDLFPRAAFYLINLFDSNRITPIIANCCDSDLNLRLEDLTKEGQDANSVFSVGGSIFKKYKNVYRSATKNIKHFRLSPMVDKNDFKLPSPEAPEEDDNFQIMSVFHEHELGNLNGDSLIIQAMNSMAKSFYKHMKSPPTWKILGVPKRCESELRNRLNLHSHLDVVFARMPSDKGLRMSFVGAILF